MLYAHPSVLAVLMQGTFEPQIVMFKQEFLYLGIRHSYYHYFKFANKHVIYIKQSILAVTEHLQALCNKLDQ